MTTTTTYPSLKLTYFEVPGRGELIRLAFAHGAVPFEDERVPFEAFKALRPRMPLGQLPIMDVDGTTYVQSMAMARYAGKLSGLYPDDPVEALRIDMVLESIVEIANEMSNIEWNEPSADAKAKRQTAVEAKTLQMCELFERMAIGPFLFGETMTLADVSLYDHIEHWLKPYCPVFDDVAKYPNIERVCKSVAASPRIAHYLATTELKLGP